MWWRDIKFKIRILNLIHGHRCLKWTAIGYGLFAKMPNSHILRVPGGITVFCWWRAEGHWLGLNGISSNANEGVLYSERRPELTVLYARGKWLECIVCLTSAHAAHRALKTAAYIARSTPCPKKSSTRSLINNFANSQRIFIFFSLTNSLKIRDKSVIKDPTTPITGRYTTLWNTNAVNYRVLCALSHSLAEMWTARALRMAHSNSCKRIKLSIVDLNSRIDKYHTGVVQFKCVVCHQ